MDKKLLAFAWLFFALFFQCYAQEQTNPEITTDELYQHIDFLAADSLKGREPGTSGSKIASDYIISQLKIAGLQPFEKKGFQYFKINTGIKTGKNTQLTYGKNKATHNEDFIPLSYSANKSLSAKVVFAGYGFDIEDEKLKWNDYENINVKGKWVLILRGNPQTEQRPNPYRQHASLRSKILAAKDNGAAGVLFVSGAEFEKDDKLIPMRLSRGQTAVSIPVLHITRQTANGILRDKTIESLEKKLNVQKQPVSYPVNTKVKANVDLIIQKVKTQNIVAFHEGSDPELKDQYIVIGAHYDHLGMGGEGSGSRVPDTVAVHNGADDNASGVAAVIEIAERFANSKNGHKRSIIAVAFGAEEKGLLGSKYFVANSPVDVKNIKAMINIDMLGRFDTKTKALSISGVGTSVEADTILKQYNLAYKFSLGLTPDGYGPSDHASFYAENIPVFFFSTGAHEDYHTPKDDIELINIDGAKKAADYIYDVTYDIINRDTSLTFKEAGPKKRSKFGNLKVTLGIMPGFGGTDIKGLRVGGVRGGGPASKAGMKKGDVIVALNGKKVEDIYEYMERLSEFEAGDTITVDVIRDDEKKVLIVQF